MTATMAPQPEQCLLAVTAYREAEVLLRTISALHAVGVDAAQLGLVALPAVMARLSVMTGEATGVHYIPAGLLREIEDWPGAERPNLVTSSAALGRSLRRARKGATAVRARPHPMLDIERYAADGDIVLIVRASDAKQQLSVTRQLLADSARHVMTYAFPAQDD